MLTSFLLATVVQASALTPNLAALHAIYVDPKKPAIVKRVNVAGAYATVLTTGGRIEGELVTTPILVERFPFGWQALVLLEARCDLDAFAFGTTMTDALMRGLPKLEDDRPCHGPRFLRDAGPPRDIATIRQMMRGPLVPSVVVSRDWAMGEWYGGGGGQSLYRKRNGRWQFVIGGGGALGADYMRKFGVPRSDWCAFRIFDAACR